MITKRSYEFNPTSCVAVEPKPTFPILRALEGAMEGAEVKLLVLVLVLVLLLFLFLFLFLLARRYCDVALTDATWHAMAMARMVPNLGTYDTTVLPAFNAAGTSPHRSKRT